MGPALAIGTAFISTAVFLKLLEPAARKIGLVDVPGGRKAHLSTTPVHGGIAIFLGVALAMCLDGSLLQLYWPLLLTSFIVLTIGVADDLHDMNPRLKLALHALVTTALVLITDTRIESLGNLLGFGNIELGIMSYPFTVFCFLAGINAINMIDGIDGLAGGLVLIPLALVGIMLMGTNSELALMAGIVCVSIGAFLISNYRTPWRRKASAFLGDSGSTTIGFILVWLLINASAADAGVFPPVVALWLLAIPLIDSGCVIYMRRKEGRSPMAAGRDHVHHRLQDLGCSVSRTTMLLHIGSLALSLLAIAAVYAGVEAWLLFGMISVVFSANLYAGTHFLTLISSNKVNRSPRLVQKSVELITIAEDIPGTANQSGKKAA